MGAIVVAGDSFSAGHPTIKTWPHIFAERTGAHVINRAIWGSGYVGDGPGPGGQPNRFLRQVMFQANPGLVTGVVLAGSINDQNIDPNLYRAMTLMTHLQVLNTYPNAKLMVLGPIWSGPNPPPANVLRCRDILLETMWSYDWKHPLIDPIRDGWFPMNRPDWWTDDQFHLNQAGQIRFADMIHTPFRNYFGV